MQLKFINESGKTLFVGNEIQAHIFYHETFLDYGQDVVCVGVRSVMDCDGVFIETASRAILSVIKAVLYMEGVMTSGRIDVYKFGKFCGSFESI